MTNISNASVKKYFMRKEETSVGECNFIFNGECKILDVDEKYPKCRKDCKFYKTEEQFELDKAKAVDRVVNLPYKARKKIYKKYGRKPYEIS